MTNNIPAISFRLTPEEYKLWQILAHEAGLSEGTYAKQMATLHIRAKQKEFGMPITPPAIQQSYPKATEEALAEAFISEDARREAQEDQDDEIDIRGDEDEELLVFIEEPYIGELDSPDFLELKKESGQ